nr:hypothetical protein [Mycoplasmopsis bovis]
MGFWQGIGKDLKDHSNSNNKEILSPCFCRNLYRPVLHLKNLNMFINKKLSIAQLIFIITYGITKSPIKQGY